MTLKISVNNKQLPKGELLDIGGVAVENGSSVSLDEEQELSLANRVGMPVREYFKDSEDVKVEGTASVSSKDIPAEGGEK